MGATTIIETPICVTGATYFKNNKNKVYIGYSYTDKVKNAIRGIAIKTEILSVNEPAESITVDGNAYQLVAEAASGVTTLPRAINLIGTDNQQDALVPTYLRFCHRQQPHQEWVADSSIGKRERSLPRHPRTGQTAIGLGESGLSRKRRVLLLGLQFGVERMAFGYQRAL